MHNLKRNIRTIDESFDDAKKGLRKDKREFLDKGKASYKKCCQDYDHKGDNGTLNQLKPRWAKEDENHTLAKGLYGSNRPFISNHWDSLSKTNPDHLIDTEIICPICSLKVAEETDHFVPLSLFPEYSCHLTNLIPLCHPCNHLKSDDWLDKAGKQIFFNAYFDKIEFDKTFEVTIIYDRTKSILKGHVGYTKGFNPKTKPIDFRIKCTCDKLGLLSEYKSRVSSLLRTLTSHLRSSYNVAAKRYASVDEFVVEQVQVWDTQLKSGGFTLPIEKLFYRHLISNKALHSDIAHFIANNPI